MNNYEFTKYGNIDDEVFSAFCLSVFNNINWKMNSTNDYCYVDQYVTATTKSGKEQTYNVELKMRPFPAYTPNHITDSFMEVDKNKNMQEIGYNKVNLYVVIYPYIKTGGCVFIWNLNEIDNIDQYKSVKLMNKKTCVSRDYKIEKEIYKLPIDLAKCYQFESKHFYENKKLK